MRRQIGRLNIRRGQSVPTSNKLTGHKARFSREMVGAILDGSHPRFGHTVHYTLNFVIFLSVVLLSLESVETISDQFGTWFLAADFLIISVFAIEYALRIWSAKSRWRYVLSFWGIVDLLSFAPALLSPYSSSAALRALRLIRLLKLTRASGAIDILWIALNRVRFEMLAMLLLGAITLYLSAVGIYLFERHVQPDAFGSIPAAIWWAAVTLTTVGYGDVYPVTMAGRAFTMVVLTLGLGVVAVPTALLSASLVDVIRDREDERRKPELCTGVTPESSDGVDGESVR